MSGPAPPLEVRDVTRRYGPVVAVEHLSLEVRPGEILGFLGPNGAGKTQDVYQKHYKDQSGVRAKSSPSNEKTRKPGEASTTKPNAVGAVTDKKRATPTVSDTQEDKTKR